MVSSASSFEIRKNIIGPSLFRQFLSILSNKMESLKETKAPTKTWKPLIINW